MPEEETTNAGTGAENQTGTPGDEGAPSNAPLTEDRVTEIVGSAIKDALGPVGNGLQQIRRHLKIDGKGRSTEEPKDDDSGQSDAEKRANARDRQVSERIAKIDARQIRTDIRDAVQNLGGDILPTARSKIEDLLKPYARVDDEGETVYDRDGEILTLAEAAKKVGADPIFQKAKNPGGGGGRRGSAGDGGGANDPVDFGDLDIDSMSDEDFAKLRERRRRERAKGR